MSNEEIISRARTELLRAGVLKAHTLTLSDGSQIDRPEEIHTYEVWKSLGFQVNRGEHAIARLQVWRVSKKTKPDGTEEGRMFMHTACFFAEHQVSQL